MNKSAVISVLVVTIALLGGLVLLGRPVPKPNSSPISMSESPLKSTELLYDFGTISMAKGNVSHEFKITNTSNKPVRIRDISTSCMCTKANFKFNNQTYGPFGMPGMGGMTSVDVTINPGDSAIAEAIYDPNAHGPAGVGSIDRFLYLRDESGSQLALEIKAEVTP